MLNKKENKENTNKICEAKIRYINYEYVARIILAVYCIMLFKNSISMQQINVINYSLSINCINKYILSEVFESRISYCLKNLKNDKYEKDSVNFKKVFDLNEKLALLGLQNDNNCIVNFEKVEDVNIVFKYIIDMLFLIIYCIYSKSRKKEVFSSIKYNKICVN